MNRNKKKGRPSRPAAVPSDVTGAPTRVRAFRLFAIAVPIGLMAIALYVTWGSSSGHRASVVTNATSSVDQSKRLPTSGALDPAAPESKSPITTAEVRPKMAGAATQAPTVPGLVPCPVKKFSALRPLSPGGGEGQGEGAEVSTRQRPSPRPSPASGRGGEHARDLAPERGTPSLETALATPDLPLTNAQQEQALRQEQLDAAEQLVRTFPTDPNALYLLGLVYQEQGRSDEALAQWERCRRLNPTRADLYSSMGQTYFLKGDLDQAVEMLRKALVLEPSLFGARICLAETLNRQGKMVDVVTTLTDEMRRARSLRRRWVSPTRSDNKMKPACRLRSRQLNWDERTCCWVRLTSN